MDLSYIQTTAIIDFSGINFMLRIVAITEEIVGKTKITRIYINGIMESYRWTYVGKSEAQNEKIVKTYKSVA